MFRADAPSRKPLGVITRGSLGKGVEMKLEASESIEEVVAGTFVVVEGERYDFFALITDVSIEAANENILLNPPSASDELLREVLRGTGTYATVSLKPLLMMPKDDHAEFVEARSIKTVPSHFAPVATADAEDVARIFGAEENPGADGKQKWFAIGEPLGMDGIPVCLDLDRLIERSNAVFGKTGTGKTFLTRLLLAGTIKTGKAVNLVFDMHSEYGQKARQEGGGSVKGLRTLFPTRVVTFTLDPASTRKRGASYEKAVYLYADQIEPGDILPLQQTLNLNATAAESSYLLQNKYRDAWLTTLLGAESGEEIEALAEEVGAHVGSLSALRRKLLQLDSFDFFKAERAPKDFDVVEDLLRFLDDGRSIIFEFGRYDTLLAYLLVANVVTRRLRERYEEKALRYLQTENEADKPNPLIITIEEAHKFLSSGVARETPFGKIAREMRKFFVSLLIVDQRPSAIDEEVLSQIGTKIVAQLSDEKDIAAVLTGTAGASDLRQILASLDSKQQALILGHASPMPVVIRSRTYDEAFYAAMQDDGLGLGLSGDGGAAAMEKAFEKLF
jgi:DNA helicase HerA-like ATPase